MKLASLVVISMIFSGCWLAAGAQAGYVLTQEERTAKETMTDQYLVTAVKTKLLADSDVAGFDINVDSFKGVVTLKGVVDSSFEANEAIRIAKNTEGVKGVVSKLAVM